jgi:hypothetical protein
LISRGIELHKGASIFREKDLITFFNCWRDDLSSISPSPRTHSNNRALINLQRKEAEGGKVSEQAVGAVEILCSSKK